MLHLWKSYRTMPEKSYRTLGSHIELPAASQTAYRQRAEVSPGGRHTAVSRQPDISRMRTWGEGNFVAANVKIRCKNGIEVPDIVIMYADTNGKTPERRASKVPLPHAQAAALYGSVNGSKTVRQQGWREPAPTMRAADYNQKKHKTSNMNDKAPATREPAVTASGRKKIVSTAKGSLTMAAMAIMIITSILSLRGLPSEAKFGIQSVFYYIFAAIVFLLPFSLVCAELASTYSKSGGLYRWISEAFGPRWGWTAMYLEWQTIVIWFPTMLMFGAASLAYIFWPESFDKTLASNKTYTLVVALAIYWATTLNAFRGQKMANRLSTAGGLFGTIIPGAILIVLGVLYVCMGKHDYLDHVSFFPDFSNLSTVVLAASIFLFYGGMEIQAVHVNDMSNPAKQFPRSVFLAMLVIVAVYAIGTLMIGLVIPSKDIDLLQSLLIAYKGLWGSFGLGWLGNVMALFIMFGVIGQASALVTGPATGLMAVAQSGYLPLSMQKVNKSGVNTRILMAQGLIVTALTLVLLVLPTVESAYQLMSQMATIIYLIMVLMIYGAFLRLRRTQPGKKRGFRVPGGRFGMWLVSIVGILGAFAALALSYLPPSQIQTGSPVVYIGILLAGVGVFVALPLVVYARRKPSWRNPDAHFYPFDWQIEGRKPSEVSRWSPGYEPTEQQVEAAEDDAISRHATERHM